METIKDSIPLESFILEDREAPAGESVCLPGKTFAEGVTRLKELEWDIGKLGLGGLPGYSTPVST